MLRWASGARQGKPEGRPATRARLPGRHAALVDAEIGEGGGEKGSGYGEAARAGEQVTEDVIGLHTLFALEIAVHREVVQGPLEGKGLDAQRGHVIGRRELAGRDEPRAQRRVT